MTMKNRRISKFKIAIVILAILLMGTAAYAEADLSIFGNNISISSEDDPNGMVASIQIVILLTILTLAPSIIIMMTSFTRTIIVLSFTRNALGTQQMPPNQVLIGLAVFLTLFIMAPVFSEVNSQAIQPYVKGEITQEAAIESGLAPIREFMFKQTREKDMALFLKAADMGAVETIEEIPTTALVPAFVISEIKTAFQIGFIIFVPFLVIDMIVASTLMSMGMMMLPPVMISLPFKILLFILVDGWHLLIGQLIMSFN